MRNLRLYKTDIEFKTYEEFCGGDGLSTKSIVPGVSMSNDIKKRYFNPKDEVVLFHEITINYKDKEGNTLAPSTTKRVKYISGVTSEIVLTPKNVEGFEAREVLKTVQIPKDTVVDFVYDKKYTKEDPLTFEILSNGVIRWKAQNTPYTVSIDYKLNDGEWTSITSATGNSAPSISVNEGDVIQFRGDNATYSSGSSRYNYFSGTTCQFKVCGNIMSLVNSTEFATATLSSDYNFYYLFYNCTGLTSAENLILPATTLTNHCYDGMFRGCIGLTQASSLPATTLASNCYESMFNGCTSLTSAPSLPAITLADWCYYYMFQGCTSLTQAPELPATTLAIGCYQYMFQGCTSLAQAPALPTTTLANWCYSSMFNGCTSLTEAPELPATALATGCYYYMFYGCTNLNYIKCLATDISASSSHAYWVGGVAPSGIFVKGLTASWPIGINGIPTNWIEIDINSLGADKRNVNITEKAGSFKLKVYNGSGQDWTASTNDEWLLLERTQDSEVLSVLNVGYTETQNERTGSILITNGIETFTINVVQEVLSKQYFTFNIISSGTLYWKTFGDSYYSKTISYSKNNGEWISITSSSSSTMPKITVSAGDVIKFKGNNDAYNERAGYPSSFSGSSGVRFSVKGNIMSLIYDDDFVDRTGITKEYTFVRLFGGCACLIDASNLVLPTTTLRNYCYNGMFSGCTRLTTAPTLPATTLAEYCYSSMFQNCTSLTQVSELPATTLANNCYYQMFRGCTSLTSAPSLPATTLASFCYGYMFAGCTKLTQAPELPATRLKEYCYSYMFQGCTSLTTAPELSATTLATYCCQYMFSKCTSLTTAPALPATALALSCYSYMFSGCTSLTSAPELPATRLKEYCYQNMFVWCTALTQAPALPATTLADFCYQNMFQNCTSLRVAPELPATTLAERCYQFMFQNCTSLSMVPEKLPATTLADYCYSYMFQNCTSLITAPELPAETLAQGCYNSMFYGCTNLNHIKCLATNISVGNCTTGWANGVASSGVFEKDVEMNDWESGVNGIPNGWTVQEAITFEVSSSNVNFYDEGGQVTIKIKNTTGTGWTANGLTYWLSLSESASTEPVVNLVINVYSIPNSGVARSANIVLTNGTDTCGIKIEQKHNYNIEYFTFQILSDGDIVWEATHSNVTRTIEYKKNDGEWTSITSATGDTAPSISVVEGDVVRFRGDNSNYASGRSYNLVSSSASTFGKTTCQFNVCGNIMSLITSTGFNTATTLTSMHTFSRLFEGCAGLNSSENLILPATTLRNYCYGNMFAGCTRLTSAPELPAETLIDGCYAGMFDGCTSLTTAPELPAMTLADYCYQYMFSNCAGLTQAPELPATRLASYCYQYMFYGCASLTQAPVLSATTLAWYCYSYMFAGCTNLTSAPELPATALTDYCYSSMFQGCTGLTQAPELPATSLVSACYQSMFNGCASLTQAPVLSATSLAQNCYRSMFYGCTSLTQAPVLPATTLYGQCYYQMFNGCTGLTSAPELPATTLATGCYYYMFYGCTNLNYIKCLATDISASSCLSNWVNGVASSGTFVKAASMTGWTTGIDGIPNNWTVQDAS